MSLFLEMEWENTGEQRGWLVHRGQGLVAGVGHESGLFLLAKERKPPFTYLCR